MNTRPPARPAACRGHRWRLTGLADARDGTHAQYECDLCERILWVAPGARPPVVRGWGRRSRFDALLDVREDQQPVQP